MRSRGPQHERGVDHDEIEAFLLGNRPRRLLGEPLAEQVRVEVAALNCGNGVPVLLGEVLPCMEQSRKVLLVFAVSCGVNQHAVGSRNRTRTVLGHTAGASDGCDRGGQHNALHSIAVLSHSVQHVGGAVQRRLDQLRLRIFRAGQERRRCMEHLRKKKAAQTATSSTQIQRFLMQSTHLFTTETTPTHSDATYVVHVADGVRERSGLQQVGLEQRELAGELLLHVQQVLDLVPAGQRAHRALHVQTCSVQKPNAQSIASIQANGWSDFRSGREAHLAAAAGT